jgi:tetrahydromethanopterin S-methyltransferase subunit G
MENILDDGNVVSAERWRVWEAEGKQRDKAFARKIGILAGIVITLLSLARAFYFVVSR